MNFFKGVNILFFKELKDLFRSPLVYIITGLFCLIIGWLFYNYLIISKDITKMTMTGSVIGPVFGNMNFLFLFLAPLLTMRIFAEEKKQSTIELLFKSNLTTLQIIVSKYLACLSVVLFMISFTFIFPAILAWSGYHDWGVIFSCYLGLILSVMCYTAVGIFTSSLTENQIIAALSSFCILMAFLLLVFSMNSTNNYLLGLMAKYLSVPFHYEGFVRGAIRSYNLVYFVSFTGLFFYLTHKSLNSRNW